MDGPGTPDPQQRDVMFCHECENEWYRDELGLQCPQCESDFTQILESPLDDHTAEPSNNTLIHSGFLPPDHPALARLLHRDLHGSTEDPPFELREGPPPGVLFSATYQTLANGQEQNQQSPYSTISHLFNNILPPLRRLPNAPSAGQEAGHTPDREQGRNHLPAAFAREFPPARRFHYTANYSFSPLDDEDPGPHENAHYAHLQEGLRQLFEQVTTHGGPLALGGILNPIGGNPGDAVYSQEEFDRIVTQLMDQNPNSTAPGPAPEAAITSLPKKKINLEMLGEDGKGECSVCMDGVSLGEEVAYLPCTHWFHNSCVSAWLREHNTCPICRAGIPPPKASDSSSRTYADLPPSEAWRSNNYPEGSSGNPLLVPSSPAQPSFRAPPNSRPYVPNFGSRLSSQNQTPNANSRSEAQINQYNNSRYSRAPSSERGQPHPSNGSEENGDNESYGGATNRWQRDQYRHH
ncbi:MAG: hypothetical protein M1829_002143 [Trizodia sp. TS-e1964]|nr:MAG: hypothetical protein M1829_002143 [Trizodia sp. TS-e1964]